MALELEGRRLEDALPGRQGKLVFAYLADNRTRPVDRSELAAVLWPEERPAAAETTLSGVLSRLRHALGDDVLSGRAQPRLVLAADAWLDVEAAAAAIHQAESAVARGDWPSVWMSGRIALHVARREFLSGFEAPWIDERRRDLHTIHMSALECVGASGLGLGGSEIAAAERCGRVLIACEPYRESGYRLLMRAFEARGNVAAALTVYDELRCLLRDELGTGPSTVTQELHKQLLG
jgi:DNA-binding SARP family transcriptional activator